MSTNEEHRNKRSQIALERRMSPEWNSWSNYNFKVRSATLKNYRRNTDLIDPCRIRSYSNHIDHIVPVVYCFKNNIPAEICSSIDNLQMSTMLENCSKGGKLSDKARELLSLWGYPIIE